MAKTIWGLAKLIETLSGYTPAAASGLATLNGSTKVSQDPASKDQASGIPSLDSNSVVTQPAPSVREASGSNLKFKLIDIGDWNMDTTAIVTVADGITPANRRLISAFIREDGGGPPVYPLTPGLVNAAGYQGRIYVSNVTPANLVLERETGGTFDSAVFDSTSYNRGYVLVGYI